MRSNLRPASKSRPSERFINIAALLVCAIVFLGLTTPPGYCGNQNVPNNLLSYRDRLIQMRTDYLSRASEQNRCYSEDEAIVRQVDKILSGNPINRLALATLRYEHLRCIDQHGAYLGSLNASISKIDSELSRVESDIKYWACMR